MWVKPQCYVPAFQKESLNEYKRKIHCALEAKDTQGDTEEGREFTGHHIKNISFKS